MSLGLPSSQVFCCQARFGKNLPELSLSLSLGHPLHHPEREWQHGSHFGTKVGDEPHAPRADAIAGW